MLSSITAPLGVLGQGRGRGDGGRGRGGGRGGRGGTSSLVKTIDATAKVEVPVEGQRRRLRRLRIRKVDLTSGMLFSTKKYLVLIEIVLPEIKY